LIEFNAVDYAVLGPWRNRWGYVTEIAQFGEDDIILKSITPDRRKIICRFTDWEQCEQMVELIESDRRF